MNRPYIICHMVTSLDGKVTGDFLFHPQCEPAVEVYYNLNRTLKSNGFICGRVTMEGSFTGGWYPDLTQYEPVSSNADFLPREKSSFYAVAFDTKGRLGWKSARIIDEDPGYGGAQIIEILTAQADPRYLGYLQSLGIPYLFAGEKEIDITAALAKLKTLMGIETLLLEGGSILNGAFQRAGVIDELSLAVAPVNGETKDKSLFFQSTFQSYTLADHQVYDNGVLWLNYKIKGE